MQSEIKKELLFKINQKGLLWFAGFDITEKLGILITSALI